MIIQKIDLTLIPFGRQDLIMSKTAAWLSATEAEIQTYPFIRLFGRHLGFAVERYDLQNGRQHH